MMQEGALTLFALGLHNLGLYGTDTVHEQRLTSELSHGLDYNAKWLIIVLVWHLKLTKNLISLAGFYAI